MPAPLRIGVAPCFFHADPTRPIFKGKTLLYLEESLAHWLMAGGALPVMLPTSAAGFGVDDLVKDLDGLVLQGGSDLSPLSYGQDALKPEWRGDRARDINESALLRVCMARRLPVLGVCRGLQLINVALGGSLDQDLTMLREGAQLHRDWERYDQLVHEIRFEADSLLARAYPDRPGGRVNSVHHQGIHTLAKGLKAEALSVPDGIIEAARWEPNGDDDLPFVYGVQWHPEFQNPADTSLLPAAPIRELFLKAALSQRHRGTGARKHGRVPPKPSKSRR